MRTSTWPVYRDEIDTLIVWFESNYHFRDKSGVYMPQLQSNERCKRYAYFKSPVHIFNKIRKLNGVELHGNQLIVKETKTLPRTIYSNNTLIKSSNL